MITTEELEELIQELEGSCKSLYQTIESLLGKDEDELTIEQLEEIDSRIFHCAECGLWYSIDNESGSDPSELICNDCA